MQNANLCTKEKIDLIKQNVVNYKTLYTQYLLDKKEIYKENENVNNLIKEKNFELQNNLIKKNMDTINVNCDSENSFKDCYLKCKEKNNPNDRKPDVFVSTQCSDKNPNDKNPTPNLDSCQCFYPDYKNIDLSIDDMNKLVKKKLNLLEKEFKLVKPEDITYKDPCCSKDIVCNDGNCSSIDELCKIQPNIVESFTTHNNSIFNINYILIIIIIILIVFFLCQ